PGALAHPRQRPALRAPRRGLNDPRATREGSSVKPLGRRTYLEAKAEGENSMSGKAGRGETTKPHARRGPDSMGKARLLEPQCPPRKRAEPDTVGNIRYSPDPWSPWRTIQGGSPTASGTRSGGMGPQ